MCDTYVGMGLKWEVNSNSDLAEAFQPDSVLIAQKKLAALQKRNPYSQVFCEIYFYEAYASAYPSNSPWWYRDSKGNKVQFWQGCYNMAVNNLEYVDHSHGGVWLAKSHQFVYTQAW